MLRMSFVDIYWNGCVLKEGELCFEEIYGYDIFMVGWFGLLVMEYESLIFVNVVNIFLL